MLHQLISILNLCLVYQDRVESLFHHVIRNHEHLIMIYETWMPAYRELLKE